MATITITAFNPVYDNAHISPRLLTAPANASLTKGLAAKILSTGKLAAMAYTDNPQDFAGLMTAAVAASYMGNVFRGLAYMDGLGSVALGSLLYIGAAGALVDVDPGVNEVQTLTITGTPTGGDFTLTFGGQTTSAIAYNASAATVQAALEALSTIGTGNVIGKGGALPGTAVTLTFVNNLGKQPIAAITGTFTGLTGGTTPTGAIAETTPGLRSLAVAKVVPLWKSGGSYEKMVEIFERPIVG